MKRKRDDMCNDYPSKDISDLEEELETVPLSSVPMPAHLSRRDREIYMQLTQAIRRSLVTHRKASDLWDKTGLAKHENRMLDVYDGINAKQIKRDIMWGEQVPVIHSAKHAKTSSSNITPTNTQSASTSNTQSASTNNKPQIDKHFSSDVDSPLDQFEIRNLLNIEVPIFGDFHISLSNIALYLTIAAYISYALSLLARNYNIVLANTWSISQESVYATVHSIVINQINSKKGQVYFPFIYTLFVFILVNNLIGMIPYSFAATSHFILTFYLSFTIVLGATILGLRRHGLVFFSFFVPGGCPLGLLPLLVLIEFISYLARNVSLGLRLAANVLSGHMLLNILSGFAYNIMTSGIVYFFIGLIPLAFIIAFSGLELGIAFIQAQVFVVLTCSYIKDALDLH